MRLRTAAAPTFAVLTFTSLSFAVFGCGLREHPQERPRGMPPIEEPEPAPPMMPEPKRDAGVKRDAPPGPTGPGVMIEGTFVPKDKAIVFLHFGHSNMAGLAQEPADLRAFFFTPQPRLWSYQSGGRFVPAKEPTAPDPPVHNGAGPGMAWLRTAAAAASPDHHFISIARARGGAPSPDFLKGGLYYAPFMDLAVQLKGKVTFGALFIMMGITERHMPVPEQAGYTERLARIIADIRADLDSPDLPVLHTDYEVTSTGSLAVTTEVGRRLRPLILALPERVTNLAIVPADEIPLRDNHHFNLLGHKMWAERGIQIMIDRGWFPWAR